MPHFHQFVDKNSYPCQNTRGKVSYHEDSNNVASYSCLFWCRNFIHVFGEKLLNQLYRGQSRHTKYEEEINLGKFHLLSERLASLGMMEITLSPST